MVAVNNAVSETKLCGSRPGISVSSPVSAVKKKRSNEFGTWNLEHVDSQEAAEVKGGDVTMATEHWPRIKVSED